MGQTWCKLLPVFNKWDNQVIVYQGKHLGLVHSPGKPGVVCFLFSPERRVIRAELTCWSCHGAQSWPRLLKQKERKIKSE